MLCTQLVLEALWFLMCCIVKLVNWEPFWGLWANFCSLKELKILHMLAFSVCLHMAFGVTTRVSLSVYIFVNFNYNMMLFTFLVYALYFCVYAFLCVKLRLYWHHVIVHGGGYWKYLQVSVLNFYCFSFVKLCFQNVDWLNNFVEDLTGRLNYSVVHDDPCCWELHWTSLVLFYFQEFKIPIIIIIYASSNLNKFKESIEILIFINLAFFLNGDLEAARENKNLSGTSQYSLIWETTENEFANEGCRFSQEEESYSTIATQSYLAD